MKNIKLFLAYEGTCYKGWQATKKKRGSSLHTTQEQKLSHPSHDTMVMTQWTSIEEELQKVLEQILQHPVKLQAASRTDAGVHAEGQVVNFKTEKKIDLYRLQQGCNGLLPDDIRVTGMEIMPETFHPTLDAKGKEYHYYICQGLAQLPFHRRFSWHFVKPLDINLMRRAASHWVGIHDFSALTNKKQNNSVREIYFIEIEALNSSQIRIRVAGNHFLYKMVRNIVGTVAYAGCNMLSIQEVSFLLEKKDRTLAGMTAPAHGLTLKKVFYD